MSASIYLSEKHNEIVFAPIVATGPPLYYDREQATFSDGEPVTILPFVCLPERIGGRAKAVWLASVEGQHALKGDKALRKRFSGIADQSALFLECRGVSTLAGKQISWRRTTLEMPAYLASAALTTDEFWADYVRVHLAVNEGEFVAKGYPDDRNSYLHVDDFLALACQDAELGEVIVQIYRCCRQLKESGLVVKRKR